jgi:hypothetical protein
MASIRKLSLEYNFKVIEDASHAIGGKYRDEYIGNCRYSDITIFSFHPVKIITTAEGGMALTNSDFLAKKMHLLRSHGITRDSAEMINISDGPWYYEQIMLGFNYRMTELQAALGVSQMQRLNSYVSRRHELAGRYDDLLRDLPVVTPVCSSETYSALHLYVVRLELNKITKTRLEVFNDLKEHGIGVNVHYIPIHLHPYYQKLGFKRGDFPEAEKGEWIRIRPGSDCTAATATFVYSNPDTRESKSDPIFAGIAEVDSKTSVSTGWMRARGGNKRSLLLSMAGQPGAKPSGDICYELDGEMKLRPLKSAPEPGELKLGTSLLHGKLRVEDSSVVFTDGAGLNWRLPRGSGAFDHITSSGSVRIQREVSTERYLFNCHGTFYELPTENAGGFAKIRPVSSHNRLIGDFASYRGLLVMTGIESGASSSHIIRSDDGKAAVWAGAIDDLWKLGKPTGTGGPWLNSDVKESVPSDPYLFTGYDKKSLSLSNEGKRDVSFKVELDVTGEGDWMIYQDLVVKAGEILKHEFPDSCQAYWVRITPSADTTATARFDYR